MEKSGKFKFNFVERKTLLFHLCVNLVLRKFQWATPWRLSSGKIKFWMCKFDAIRKNSDFLTTRISRFPFNWRNLIVYLVVVILQYVILTQFFVLGAGLVFAGVGSFLFAVTATKDLKKNLRSFNKCAILAKNRSRILSQLSDSVELHSALKQLSKYSF